MMHLDIEHHSQLDVLAQYDTHFASAFHSTMFELVILCYLSYYCFHQYIPGHYLILLHTFLLLDCCWNVEQITKLPLFGVAVFFAVHESIIVGLITQAGPVDIPSRERLSMLLSTYFQDNKNGAGYRSIFCTGRLDVPISLVQFNIFVIWPLTDFKFEASRPEGEAGRVMDVETLLLCKEEPSQDIARYCNYGPVAHTMEEDEYKTIFSCNMVLCKGCYRKRKNEYEKVTMATGRRSSRHMRKGHSPKETREV
jgi:hypothetical protein